MGKAPSGILLVFLVAWAMVVVVWNRFRLEFKRGSEKKILKLFFVASKDSTARSAGCGGLLSSSKSPHGQGAFFEPLHKNQAPGRALAG